ncbi:MAG: L-aspartate oxidase [Bacteroidales bacterium]
MQQFQYIIVGSGLAGLYSAHKAARYGKVALITKSKLRESNSYFAQGGIAAVTDEEDNPGLHYQDTMVAGRGLCESSTVNILVNEGPQRIKELIDEGMCFDTENGELSLGLEGGHHRHRILHAGGDSTGRLITEFLIKKTESNPNITILEEMSVIDLLVEDNICYGTRCWNEKKDCEELYYAQYLFLTSGGASAIYSRTTNPQTTIGDGIALAYAAGCRIMDMEFIQFHPSALYLSDSPKAYLISEAVRGEGAHLLNKESKRFMLSKHELAELAPRDIVARSIYKEMLKDDRPYVMLSLKHLKADKIRKRFPNIYNKCQEHTFDLTQEIPVAPAAHYTVGGIMSNHCGRTDVQRLYVCGEVAATGIMGANRLASNSLLECLVFAYRAIEDTQHLQNWTSVPSFGVEYTKRSDLREAYFTLKGEVAEMMNHHSGIIRSDALLSTGLSFLRKKQQEWHSEEKEYYTDASQKLLTVASLIMTPARFRKESRGGHYREDFPQLNDDFTVHTIQQKGEELKIAPVNNQYLESI